MRRVIPFIRSEGLLKRHEKFLVGFLEEHCTRLVVRRKLGFREIGQQDFQDSSNQFFYPVPFIGPSKSTGEQVFSTQTRTDPPAARLLDIPEIRSPFRSSIAKRALPKTTRRPRFVGH